MKTSTIVMQVGFATVLIGGIVYLVLQTSSKRNEIADEPKIEAKHQVFDELCRNSEKCWRKIEPHFDDCFYPNFKRTDGNAWFKTFFYHDFKKCITKKVASLP